MKKWKLNTEKICDLYLSGELSFFLILKYTNIIIVVVSFLFLLIWSQAYVSIFGYNQFFLETSSSLSSFFLNKLEENIRHNSIKKYLFFKVKYSYLTAQTMTKTSILCLWKLLGYIYLSMYVGIHRDIYILATIIFFLTNKKRLIHS